MKLKIFIYIIFLLLTGCVQYQNDYTGDISVVVNALSNSSISVEKYNTCYILQRDNLNDLFDQEFIEKIEKDLSYNGLKFVKNKSNANCLISATWSIKGKTEISNIPVYNPVLTSVNHYQYGGTTFGYNYNFAGFSQAFDDVYNKTLNLKAYNNNKVIWQLNISSKGSSGNLRNFFPILSSQAAIFAKRNIENTVTYNISHDDFDFNYYLFDNKVYRIKGWIFQYYDTSFQSWTDESSNNISVDKVKMLGKNIPYIKAYILIKDF